MMESGTQALETKLWDAASLMRAAGLNTLDYIEHISYFIYLKLLDDQERMRESDDPTYHTRLGDDRWRFYSWAHQRGPHLVDFVSQQLFPYLGTLPDRPGLDNSSVRMIFSDAHLLLSNPADLGQLLSIVETIDPGDCGFEIGGHIYESLLAKMSSDNPELGQFFTQRHLVDLMVTLIDPRIGETVYDPASGTGGFLVRSYQYLRDSLDARDPDYDEKLGILHQETIYGREVNFRAHLLGVLNMILHGDGHANLERGNSLSASAQEPSRYDVIFMNPPFGRASLSELDFRGFPVGSHNLESLFLQHVMSSLKPGGRAATIVSEGTLFRGGAERTIRSWLLDEFSVEAVISLPSGVFLPHTSVKASILVFHRKGPTERVWFFEIKNDGFELTATRRPIPGSNDIDTLLELWNTKPETEQSWWADAGEIAEKDHSLSANLYAPRRTESRRYPWVRLNELLRRCKDYVVVDDSVLYKRVIVQSHGGGVVLRDEVYGHQVRTEKGQQIARAGQVIVSAIGAKKGAFGVVPPGLDGALVSQNYYLFDIISQDVLTGYLAFVLSHESLEREIQAHVRGSTGLASVRPEGFLALRIPLPPIYEQREIVDKLDQVKSALEDALRHEREARQGIEQRVFS